MLLFMYNEEKVIIRCNDTLEGSYNYSPLACKLYSIPRIKYLRETKTKLNNVCTIVLF